MIVSASRRTDIPCWYSEWFGNRVKAGFAMTRNPMNGRQLRRVSLLPEDVDCFVFWTKDPGRKGANGRSFIDILPDLDKSGFMYYFQFTLTPYGRDIERNQRDKADIERDFARLSGRAGKERVVWRYDPVILNEGFGLTSAWHALTFEKMCVRLCRYTETVNVSFADIYAKLKGGLVREISLGEMAELAAIFGETARRYGLRIRACCEKADFAAFGIERAACVDKALIERLTGRPLSARRDKNQREGCGCCESADIGAYNTCPGGCAYCYANHGAGVIRRNFAGHKPDGEFLI